MKWETTKSFNVGVDFDLFAGRITGAMEVYQSNTTDLLLPRLLPNSSGFSEILTNVGATRNTGFEFLVSTRNILPKTVDGFSWTTDFNFASNKEEIVELSQGKVDDVGNLRFIGEPIIVFYDYERIGIWQLGEDGPAAVGNSAVGQIKVKDQDGDGAITPDDRIILGSDVPDYIWGMTNRFTFKGFDLTIVAVGRIGQMIRNETWGSFRFGSGRVNMLDLNYWTADNPVNDIPQPNTSLVNPLFGSTLSYFDGTFVKIRNINLGYNFSSKVVEKLGLQSLNLYVSIQNPVWFSSYVRNDFGIDPEFPTRGTPVSRTFMTGLNINF